MNPTSDAGAEVLETVAAPPDGEVETVLANDIATPLVALFRAKDIRILGTVNDPMFVASDVATHIGDANYKRNFLRLKKKFVRWAKACDNIGRPQISRFLTEAGLYNYLLHSKMPQAEPLQLFTYDLLSKERKRAVDEKKLTIKIKQSLVLALTEETEEQRTLGRVVKAKILGAMKQANTARAAIKLQKAELDWCEHGIDRVGTAREEFEAADEESPREIDIFDLIPANPAPDEKSSIGQEIEEGSLTPLVAVFEDRDIRIAGTIDDPLFFAADVAKYIGDDDCDRIFRGDRHASYVRWGVLKDSQGQPRKTRFLTEPGLYRYLLQSALPKAEAFQEFTYDLLWAERKKTVDGVELALKIATTKADELAKHKSYLQGLTRQDNHRLNECVHVANSLKGDFKRSQDALFKAQMKKSIEAERVQIRRFGGEAAALAYKGPMSGIYFKALREGLITETRR